MAFVRVEKLRRGIGSMLLPIITLGAYLADGKVHKTKSIGMRFSDPLIQQLGWKLDERSMYININEGIDDDQGYLQIVQTTEDIHARRITRSEKGGHHGIALNMGADALKHYVLNECPVPAAPATHMIDGNALLIECPDWLRYNPESVPKKASPPVQLHPGRGRRRG